MLKYKLLIAYDGTQYGGWQVQPNATSIQTLVEKALSTALRKPTKVTGSGRTDSGVHALEQAAHFSFEGPLDFRKLLLSLNALLPPDIRVMAISEASHGFHARFSAKGKIYRYHLHLKPIQSPFTHLYSYHPPYPIDRELLKAAAHHFTGKRDFTSFSNEAHRGSASRSAIRTLKRLDLVENEEGLYLEFEADGFLYKMVRNIVGTLLDVARGKIALERLPAIFEAKDRRLAGACAPPHGLFLVKVIYD